MIVKLPDEHIVHDCATVRRKAEDISLYQSLEVEVKTSATSQMNKGEGKKAAACCRLCILCPPSGIRKVSIPSKPPRAFASWLTALAGSASCLNARQH